MTDSGPAKIPSAAELRAATKREAVKAAKKAAADAVAAGTSRQAHFDNMVPYWVKSIKADIAKGLAAVAKGLGKAPMGEIHDYSEHVFVEYSTTAGKTTATIRLTGFVRPGQEMDEFKAAWAVVAAELAAGKYESGVGYDFSKAYTDPDEGFHEEGYYASATLAWRAR